MGDKLPVLPLYWRDWLAATRGMKPAARAFYMDLLCFSWGNGPLPADLATLAEMVGAHGRSIVHLRNAISHFVLTPEGYIHTRLESERAIALAQKEKLRNRGTSAAAARWGHEANQSATSNAQALQKHSSSTVQGMPSLAPRPREKDSAPSGARNPSLRGAEPSPSPVAAAPAPAPRENQEPALTTAEKLHHLESAGLDALAAKYRERARLEARKKPKSENKS